VHSREEYEDEFLQLDKKPFFQLWFHVSISVRTARVPCQINRVFWDPPNQESTHVFFKMRYKTFILHDFWSHSSYSSCPLLALLCFVSIIICHYVWLSKNEMKSQKGGYYDMTLVLCFICFDNKPINCAFLSTYYYAECMWDERCMTYLP